MKINTKFDVGDRVFFMNDNKVCETNIERITITTKEDNIEIKYLVKVSYGYESLLESKVFTTKQELLNTL